ncbi:hypothetical protein ACIRVK_02225 [Streptomyces sp. NPDC101152]|uniref:hypothetical protein n=1 Tax=Streptomyces sp. NPDC101152 TaxID=3366116 RepID=UPI0037F3628B
MYVRRHRRTLLVGAAVATILAGGTGAAVAESTPAPAPTAKSAPAGDGAKALCKRAPKIEHRIDRALKRLNAGADRRGSIARLQQRVDKAKAAGHSEIATYLQDKLTFRKSLVTTLQQRQKDLAGVQTWCKDNNGGAS